MPVWLAAFLPLVGAVVGAVLQHALSRSQEAMKHRQALKSTAYVDYLRGVAQTAQAQQRGDQVGAIEGNALMADAKARTCVYGDAHVIGALAKFSRLGASLASREGVAAFLALCQAMRGDAGDAVSNDDLARVLFNASVSELPSRELLRGDESG